MLTALLAATLLSQGLNTSGPGLAAGGKVLASFPLTTSGALIAEDANTVAHVYWNGTALVDTKGNSWTQNGTVPQVTANPFTTTRYGAGPFSGANYYSLASTNPLQFAGDFTVCVVYVKKTDTSAQILVTSGDASTVGWRIQENSGSRPYLIADGFNGGTENVNDASSTVTDGPNVVCAGVASGSIKIKVNLRATISATPTAPYTAGTSAAQIGYDADGVGTAVAGTIYEVYATSTPFTEATVTAIQQKVLGHYDGYAPLAVIRATNATYENPAGTVWTAAPGVARITTDGLLVEPARTNYVLQSTTHPKVAEAMGTLPTGLYYARHTGGGTMTIAAGTSTMTGLSCTTVAVGTPCTFTVTVTGIPVITTTAGATRAQVELGGYGTSWINTTTTALARNADAISATVPAVTSKFSVAGTFKKGNDAPWTSGTPWSLGTAAGADSASLTMGAANLVFTLIDGSVAAKTCTVTAPGYAAGSSNALTAKDLAGTMSLTGGCTQAGAGTGQFAAAPTTLYLGQTSAGDQFSGFIKSLTLNKVTK